MQQPLEHTRSYHMHHSSTVPDTYTRPTPARVPSRAPTPAVVVKTALVWLLAWVLAWKPSLAIFLGRLVLRV
jgi:hypothetical protein